MPSAPSTCAGLPFSQTEGRDAMRSVVYLSYAPSHNALPLPFTHLAAALTREPLPVSSEKPPPLPFAWKPTVPPPEDPAMIPPSHYLLNSPTPASTCPDFRMPHMFSPSINPESNQVPFDLSANNREATMSPANVPLDLSEVHKPLDLRMEHKKRPWVEDE